MRFCQLGVPLPKILKSCYSKISWAYNWFSQEGGSLASGINYFPMLWGGDSGHTNSWMANAKAAIAAGSTHLLL